MDRYFLRSSRVGFRPWSKSDLPLALALWGDPAVTRWIGGPWNEPQVRERLDQEIRSMHARGIQYWPIFLLTTGEHLGCCGLRPYPGDDLTLELGVHLRRDFWGAGLALESARTVIQHGFETLGARSLFAGHNPGNESSRRLVARLGFRYLRDAQRRGMQIIAVDPRRSELASRADVHLQVRPGEDPTLLAGMVRVILEEDLCDRAFVAAHLEGVSELRAAVAGFTPDYVESRAGVPADFVQKAARLFARGPRGAAVAATGVNMAPRPDVTTHLVCALNSLCGRFNREGEEVANPGVLAPLRPRHAEVVPPREIWGKGYRSRFRGLGEFMGEMPINVFADEVLTPGPGQIKALISVGGNPVVAFPDQRRVIEAMQAL